MHDSINFQKEIRLKINDDRKMVLLDRFDERLNRSVLYLLPMRRIRFHWSIT